MQGIILKSVCAIREGRFIRTLRNYLAKTLVTGNWLVIKGMSYLPDDKRISVSADDYVRISALELMSREINNKDIKGNVDELGVYQGDFAKYINQFFSGRKLYLFDTFEGFNDKDIFVDIEGGHSTGTQDFSNTSVELVMKKMPNRRDCVIRKGWFPESTSGLDDEEYVFVSIDADLFEPIYHGLCYFGPKLKHGGAIFVHDFNNKHYHGSAAAVRKFSVEKEIGYFLLPDECGTAVLLK